MNGLATLREIRAAQPRLPVIMFSALTERGAADTLEALHHGASDYVTKPASAAGRAVAEQRIREDLVPKIRSLCRVGKPAPVPAPPQLARPIPPPPPIVIPYGLQPAGAVAIGLSTGGPQALADILGALPVGFAAPILVVQHMPSMFTRFFAERLNGQTPLTVVEAEAGQPLERGHVYVAPGDFHLIVRKSVSNGRDAVTALHQEAPIHAHRPAVDALFRSMADVYGPRALGLVLTGMGEDGLRGSEDITRAGGRVLAQDEATSLVWEMAGRVARAGLAEAVLPLPQIAAELIRRTSNNPGASAPRTEKGVK